MTFDGRAPNTGGWVSLDPYLWDPYWAHWGGGWQLQQIRKVADKVECRGLLARNTVAGTAVLNLPAPYRPLAAQKIFVGIWPQPAAPIYRQASVYTDGKLEVDDGGVPAGGWISLNNVYWYTS